MSPESHETPDFNWSRWILWGVIAILVLAVATFGFIWLGNQGDTTSTPSTLLPGGGEQVEWSIEVSEYGPSPGEVTLKGDSPLGFPTETWKEDFLVIRNVGGDFEWNMKADPPVPIPVDEINNAAGCDELQQLLEIWANEVGTAPGDGPRLQAEAFAQHAANTMNDQGCEITTG